ncbi:MAG TPA: L-tyrosine/L-tryptophan isonitrile synthase family protein, partial [Kineosporiaceae bacterium]
MLVRLPDHGERLALRFLHGLAGQLERVHPPGVRVLVCSDGHVFADLIGVTDEDVDAYVDALRGMI